MIIDEPTNSILPCECGYKPDHYSIAYGRTPYSIHCRGCDKSLHGGCNDPQWFFGFWNQYVRQIKAPGKMYTIQYSSWYKPLIFESRLMGLSTVGKPLNPVRNRLGQFDVYHPPERCYC